MQLRPCFLLLFFLSLFAQAHDFTVVIDPGHGGIDTGAVRDIFKESEITLQIAQKIKSILEKNPEKNLHVILTRETNRSLSLEKRVLIAEENKADLFISLHANSSSANYVNGMEFYFKKGTSPKSLVLADDDYSLLNPSEQDEVKKIVADLVNFGHTKQSLKFNQLLQTHALDEKTVIKRAPYYVIEKTSMPSVLIEVGYISNLSEAKLLLTDERQQQIAETIVKTITDFRTQFSGENPSE